MFIPPCSIIQSSSSRYIDSLYLHHIKVLSDSNIKVLRLQLCPVVEDEHTPTPTPTHLYKMTDDPGL